MSHNPIVAESPNRSGSRFLTLNETLALMACIVLMIVLGWLCRNRMNPDAADYLRLASYYVSGSPYLAVSGHWSPLISCLMAPLLGMGIDPLVTARIVTGMAGLLFWFGSLFLLKRLGLPLLAVALGVWCLSFACASWSVAVITPDLLAAGLICFAIRAALADDWFLSWKRQCLVGGLWALAYYGKAIALPLCILTCIGLAAWRVAFWRGARAAGTRSVALTFAVFLVLTAPWVTLLSLKYHRFTISTAGRTGRVLTGPQCPPGPYAFGVVPEPGRIFASESFDYPTVWSPFESVSNAKHQLGLLFKNGRAIKENFGKLDFFSIGFVSLPVVLILVLFERALFREQKWAWSLVPVLALAAIYGTNYCYDRRYYWVLLPFFLALAFGLAELLVEKAGVSRLSKYSIFGLIALSFTLEPLYKTVAIVCHPTDQKGISSDREMARRLKEKQLLGPVVGGFYVAYFLNQPSYGLMPATVTQLLTSRARIIIVGRNEPMAKELASDSRFRDLDKDLFGDSQAAAQSELKAFELLH